MTSPVFIDEELIEATPGSVITLSGSEAKHAVSAMRMHAGESIDIVNGQGLRVSGVVAVGSDPRELRVEVIACVVEEIGLPSITVVQAIPKGDRAELAVSMLTEVGVERIIPWESEHCVVQWRGDRADKGVAKWRGTAREAAKQARRSTIPEITDRVSTSELIEMVKAGVAEGCVVWVLDETGEGIPNLDPQSTAVWLVVGPEGGLSSEERAALSECGAQRVRCGRSVLRASTAGVVGVSVVNTLTGWQ